MCRACYVLPDTLPTNDFNRSNTIRLDRRDIRRANRSRTIFVLLKGRVPCTGSAPIYFKVKVSVP